MVDLPVRRTAAVLALLMGFGLAEASPPPGRFRRPPRQVVTSEEGKPVVPTYRKIADEVTVAEGTLPTVMLLDGSPFAKVASGAHAALGYEGSKLLLGAQSQGSRRLEVSILAAELGDHSGWENFRLPTEGVGKPVFQRTVAARKEVEEEAAQALARFESDPSEFLVDWLKQGRRRKGRKEILAHGYDLEKVGARLREHGGIGHAVSAGSFSQWYTWRNDDPLNPRGYGSPEAGFKDHAWVALHPAYTMGYRIPVELPAPGLYVVVAKTEHQTATSGFLYTGMDCVGRRDGDRVHLQAVSRKDGAPFGKVDATAHWVRWESNRNRVRVTSHKSDDQGYLTLDIPEGEGSGWVLLQRGDHLMAVELGGYASAREQLAELRRDPVSQTGQPLMVHLTTDRQVYKPGETIRFRGIARRLVEGAELAVVRGAGAQVRLGWDWEEQGSSVEVRSDDLGVFHGSLELPKDQRTGTFPLRASFPELGGEGSVEIEILAYRKPEHEVVVEAPREWTVQGEEASYDVHGRFTVGGNLAGAEVRWELRAGAPSEAPFDSKLHGFAETPGWTWRDSEGEIDFEDSGSGKLDDRGRIRIPVRLPAKKADYSLTAEVTVVSPDGREVHGNAVLYAPRSEVVLGLQTTMAVVEEKEPWIVLARTVDLEGKGKETEVELELRRRRWLRDEKDRWTEKVDVLRTWTEKTDSRGAAQWRIAIPEAGDIELTGRIRDAGRRATSSRIRTFRLGEGGGWWRWDRIELSAERPEYQAGETARVLVRCPIETGIAWWSLEGAHFRKRGQVAIKGYSALVEVPIEAADAPVAKLHVETVKDGRNLQEEIDLKVPATDKRAKVDLVTDRRVYEPGSEVDLSIEARTSTGLPMVGDLCLAVVDEALEQVAPDRTPEPYQHFYGERQNSVSGVGGGYYASDELAMADMEGGPGLARASFAMQAKGMKMAMMGAPMPASAPAAEMSMDGGGGGSGGGGGGSGIRVRTEFRDVAHWVGSVRTDRQGKARLRFKLPDDLSRWRLVTYAVDAETRVARAETRVVARKDLMVRLGMPRFLVTGDHVLVKSSVQNVTDTDSRGKLEFEIDGARAVPLEKKDLALLNVREASEGGWLVSDDGPVKKAPDRYELKVSAHGHDAVDFPVYVHSHPDSGELKFRSRFDAGGVGDALEKRIPVLPFGRRRTEVTLHEVDPRASVVVEAKPGTWENATYADLHLMLGLERAIEVALVDDLNELVKYPYGCTEQTLSRFVPLVTAQAGLGSAWLKTAGVPTDLDPIVQKGIERLRELRRGAGWGWGLGDEASTTTTAYLLSRVAALKGPIRDRIWKELELESTVEWLSDLYRRNGREAIDREEASDERYRTLAIYRAWEALALAGAGDLKAPRLPRMKSLLDDPRFWVSYGRGSLASGDQDGVTRAAQELERLSLGNQAFKQWKHEGMAWSWYADDSETVALVLEFLGELEGRSESFLAGLRWMTLGKGATEYRSTKARAVAASVAVRYLQGRAASGSRDDAELRVEAGAVRQARVSGGKVGPPSRMHLAARDLNQAKGRVTIEKTSGPKVLARLDTTRFEKGPFAAEDHGFSLRSRIEAKADPHPSHERLVREVEMTVPEDRSFALLEVPLLSGAEVPTKGEHRPKLAQKDSRGRWYDAWPEVDVLDDRVVYYFRYLSAGTYRATVTMTPEIAGFHNVLPARVFLMYFPHVEGSSESHRVSIGRADR